MRISPQSAQTINNAHFKQKYDEKKLYLWDATAVFDHVFVGFLCFYLYCRTHNSKGLKYQRIFRYHYFTNFAIKHRAMRPRTTT